jgi:hypothetical protein
MGPVEVQLHLFLTFALQGVNGHLPRPSNCTPRESNPQYVLKKEAGWAPEAVSILQQIEKDLLHPAHSPVVIPTELTWLRDKHMYISERELTTHVL